MIISSSPTKTDVFKVKSILVFVSFDKVKGKKKKVGTMIGNKTIVSQGRFTALEDSDAGPVPVTLRDNLR